MGNSGVCLEYHIGNCKGPCVGKQTEEAYAASIAAIRHVLRGHLGEVVRTLQGQMAEAAEAFQFEEAEQYKRKLAAVKKYQAKNTIVHTGITEVEAYSIVQDARCAYVNFLKIQNGTITKGHTSEVRRKLGEDTKEILEAAIVQMRDKFGSDANTIYTPFEIDLPLEGVQLHVPQRGDKLRLVEMSERNARFFMRDRQKQMEQTHPEAATQRLLETAKEDPAPHRIARAHRVLRQLKHPRHQPRIRLRRFQKRQACQIRLPQIQHPHRGRSR